MTTDEIRALVAQKIAGQGSAVDVGGGLPAILNAICDKLDAVPSEDSIPKPILLDTDGLGISPDWDLAHLYGAGLTTEEVRAAYEGKRTCVKVDVQDGFFPIQIAFYQDDNNWQIIFSQMYVDSDNGLYRVAGWNISVSSGSLNIEKINF